MIVELAAPESAANSLEGMLVPAGALTAVRGRAQALQHRTILLH